MCIEDRTRDPGCGPFCLLDMRARKRFGMPSALLWAESAEDNFEFRNIGTPAGVPIFHFHSRGRKGKRYLQYRFLRKRGTAVCGSRWRGFVPTSSADFPKSQIIIKFRLKCPERNDDDRRQRRKQGGVVGAAASKTQVPLKARSGCWEPQPDKRRAF